ncbi:hypothetical protein GLW05_10270 [Pontibacillus yanchengensis]|uniref:Uncharacterized protein n=1 Tax=Pontibacillus yanchengensis TaxID=462910 RepID=A0A6I5A132_9BACI|nr:hypothetical protein [Pontibacillus yanchengensis]MYL33982.1 hypothetical protein [Pontibacillus yanchengensis]
MSQEHCDACRKMQDTIRKHEEILTQLIHFVGNNHERIILMEKDVKSTRYQHLIS